MKSFFSTPKQIFFTQFNVFEKIYLNDPGWYGANPGWCGANCSREPIAALDGRKTNENNKEPNGASHTKKIYLKKLYNEAYVHENNANNMQLF